jgi:hypothetical protein
LPGYAASTATTVSRNPFCVETLKFGRVGARPSTNSPLLPEHAAQSPQARSAGAFSVSANRDQISRLIRTNSNQSPATLAVARVPGTDLLLNRPPDAHHRRATASFTGAARATAVCPLKPRCCPNTPARKVPRSIYERARDLARSLAGSEAFEQSRHDRKRIEMRFAHLKRILRLGRLRLRGPRGAQDEFMLAARAQNLRWLAKLVAEPRKIAGHLAPVAAT